MRDSTLYMEIMMDKTIKNELVKRNQYRGATREKMEKHLAKAKKRYRSHLKEEAEKKYLYGGEIVASGGGYDSFWQKIFFKDDHWTEEEKQEFIEAAWIHAKPSQYDCTGQVFTWAIDVFNVPNGVVAYIRNALDV